MCNVNTLSTLFSRSCQEFHKKLGKGKEKAESLAFVQRILNFLSMSGESFRILFCVCFRFWKRVCKYVCARRLLTWSSFKEMFSVVRILFSFRLISIMFFGKSDSSHVITDFKEMVCFIHLSSQDKKYKIIPNAWSLVDTKTDFINGKYSVINFSVRLHNVLEWEL